MHLCDLLRLAETLLSGDGVLEYLVRDVHNQSELLYMWCLSHDQASHVHVENNMIK